MTTSPVHPVAPTEKWVASRARVRVQVEGSGPPLLLFMGIGGSLEMWAPLIEQLRATRTLIAIDMPGTGASPALTIPRRMPGLVKIATSVLDQLGYEAVDVLGVSFGGALAQEFARRQPERTNRLVLCATSTGVISIPADPRVLVHMLHPLRYWNKAYANKIAGTIYGGRARTDGVGDTRFNKPPSLAGYIGQLWSISGWTSVSWLGQIDTPTLVMSGDDDPIVPYANARLLTLLLRNSFPYTVRGGGHLFLMEQAEESARAIEEFLSTPRATTTSRRMRPGHLAFAR